MPEIARPEMSRLGGWSFTLLELELGLDVELEGKRARRRRVIIRGSQRGLERTGRADKVGFGDAGQTSAQNPAPTEGVSPMRPGFLFVLPPVLVATASRPCWSNATAPTVPWGRVRGSKVPALESRCSSTLWVIEAYDGREFGIGGSSSGNPRPRRCSLERRAQHGS